MRRLSFSLIVAVLIAIVGTGWIIGLLYQQFDLADGQRSSDIQAYQLSGAVLVEELEGQHDGDYSLALAGPSAKALNAKIVEREYLPLPVELVSHFEGGEALTLETQGAVSIYFYMPRSGKVLSISPLLRKNQPNGLNILLTVLFYTLVVAAVLLWLYPLIRHLQTLSHTATKFGQGDLNSRIELSRVSYVHDIEQSFNQMADRIQVLLDDNKLLSRAVSHDLKTPLARLRFGVEVLAESDEPQQREKYQRRVEQDLEEMESLVSTLLHYASLEESHLRLESKPVDVVAFCNNKILATTNDDNPHLTFDVDSVGGTENSAIMILGDERYLGMILNNLISNAQRYRNSRTLLRLSSTSDYVTIEVHDDGGGVPENEWELIFKPFWRNERGGTPAGHGMGLAIVSRLATWLHADLSVRQSKQLGGACFALRFPRLPIDS